ncbi:MAG: hypothetical protein JWM27_4213 [Gemmatimonadetes bacterium]|nr:hypothetical protein [Gemmatimonadota bacterium]
MDDSTPRPEPPHTPRTVAVTGASGLLGGELVRQLARDGHRVLRLVRRAPAGPDEVRWDREGGKVDAPALEGVDAVVHLAGENVGARWTDERKRRILRSRADGTRTLAEALAVLRVPPAVLVSASAVGIYGSRGGEVLDEGSALGVDFLAQVCRAWEAAAQPAADAGIRVVHPRFGVVLSAEGGALARMLPPFRLGAGGRMGNGRQWMSWVSLEDAVGAIRFFIESAAARGPVNVAAPNPVTNADFTAALGRALGRPTLLAVPAFALRTLLGEMAESTVLASQRVSCDKLLALGYRFRHPDLDGGLASALRSPGA